MRAVLRRFLTFGPAILVVSVGPAPAGAERSAELWLVAEAPAAMAVSRAQEGVFRPGVMPAVGGYWELGPLALGVRLRAGVLRDGPAPQGNLQDPALGGLVTGALAVRGLWRGGWVEAAGGGGVTGSDVVPALELGAGWHARLGAVDVGPSVRYLRVVAAGDMASLGTAELALVGLDVRFGKAAPAPAPRRPVPQPVQTRPSAEPPPPPDPVAGVDRDAEVLVDRDASCAQAMEACLALDEVTVVQDRLILDERVVFDLGRARIRSKGRRVIRQIAALWREHPEWQRVRVEGHTCDLGDEDENRALSQRRAEQVRRVLLRRGVDPAQVEAIGVGSARPLEPGRDAEARRRNRRVEFVIERGIDRGPSEKAGRAVVEPSAEPAARPAAKRKGKRKATRAREAVEAIEPAIEPEIEIEESSR